MSQLFDSATSVVAMLRPADSVICLRPHVLRATAARYVAAFPGDVLYAVKCNDSDAVLQALHEGGIRHFDTASPAEVAQVSAQFPDSDCHYMHPVKSPEAIAEAYSRHGVRVFALDTAEELAKIAAATGDARDVTLAVRLSVSQETALQGLGGKFGASVEDAAALLRAIAETGRGTGLTFHVGSQCVSPLGYQRAIALAGRTAAMAGVTPDLLDVGGGFPGTYTGREPPFEDFVAAIRTSVAQAGLGGCRLACEPGRALVVAAQSVIARVELRSGDALYLNDGVWGNLSELKYLEAPFPMRVIRPEGRTSGRFAPFRLFGPTCDSIDSMPGPHWLPEDVRTGDWIEVGQMGAYSNVLRTRFNGFYADRVVTVADGPLVAAAEEPVRVLTAA